MDARELKGLAVVALGEAQRLGRVEDLLFETSPLRATALLLSTSTGPRYVALEDIEKVGPDAITTRSTATGQRADATLSSQDLPGLDRLARLKVVDETGRFLGQIDRIEVNPDTGDVAMVELRRGEVLGLGGEATSLSPEDLISVGEDLITVRGTRHDSPAPRTDREQP